jgi:hypothetical protein
MPRWWSSPGSAYLCMQPAPAVPTYAYVAWAVPAVCMRVFYIARAESPVCMLLARVYLCLHIGHAGQLAFRTRSTYKLAFSYMNVSSPGSTSMHVSSLGSILSACF